MKRLLFFLVIFGLISSCKKEDPDYNHFSDILISEPRRGAILDKGNTYNITWETDKAEKVRIDLYKQDQAVQIVSVSEPNSGIFRWLLPQNIHPDTNYRIRLTSVENSNISAFSHFFEIRGDSTEKYIRPARMYNNNWFEGETYEIKWETNVEEDLKIELVRGTTTIREISSNIKSTESFFWTVPSRMYVSSDYRIKISSTVFHDFYVLTDLFKISPSNNPNHLKNGNFVTEDYWKYSNPEVDPKNRWNINTMNQTGAAEIVSLQSSGSIYQELDLIPGQKYHIRYTLSRCNGYIGGARLDSGGASIVAFIGNNEGEKRFTENTYSDIIVADGSNKLGFRIVEDPGSFPNPGFICKLDNVELYPANDIVPESGGDETE